MKTSLDLKAAPREVLLDIIAQLQRRIETLEGKVRPGGPREMPGIKPKSSQRPCKDPEPEKGAEKSPRNPRPHGFARQRMTPTHRVGHVLESCPECGSGLTGGWVQRTREVIDLPVAPAEVAEHVYIARTCPMCEQRRAPPADLAGGGLGEAAVGCDSAQLD